MILMILMKTKRKKLSNFLNLQLKKPLIKHCFISGFLFFLQSGFPKPKFRRFRKSVKIKK
jgi:hypothetical protein